MTFKEAIGITLGFTAIITFAVGIFMIAACLLLRLAEVLFA